MYTVVGMVDVTDYVAPNDEDNGSSQSGGISSSASLSDPASTWDFVVDDIAQSLNIQNFMPVIVFDENQPALNGVPTVPAMNFAINPLLVCNGGHTALNNWTAGGTLSTSLWNYAIFEQVGVTFSNNTNGGTIYQSQQTLLGYVQPGVEYMLSVYVTNSSLVGVNYQLEIAWYDITNTLISSVTSSVAPASGEHQVNITGVAPANAAYATLYFGAITTSGTNSGTIVFSSVQFEPMWFTNKGVSYPTPDCNFSQVNSVQMPDGTTSRKCRLFAGYVEDHTNVYVGRQRHTAVQCAASSKLLETAGLISASYTSTIDSSILSNALSLLPVNSSIIGQLSTGQQNQFSPTSTLIAGVTVDSISFNDATMREVCNGLVAQSGSIFYVDAYYYLWYVPPSFVGTTVYLSDNPDNVMSFPYHDFSIEYDSTNPVNVTLVKGSKQKAAAITDTFSGDGSTTVFNLTEPPENVQTVTVGGSNIRTGVDGVDNAKFGSSLTYKALINKQRQIITFATAPAAGSNNIIVTYTYEDQVISQVIAADAVASQKTQFWGLVSDSNITSTTAAKNRGIKELADYAFPRVILTLSALNIYLPVGSVIFFTCQAENMTNQPFVVRTVDSDLQGGGVYSWNYTAGVYNPSLIDHIRNVHKAVKKSPTTANVAVVASIDVAIFDSIFLNDSITTNNLFTPSNGPYLYGGYAEYVKADLSAGSAYYRMDASSGTSETDASGNGFTATYSGGFTLNQAGALIGDPDKSVLFDGSSGYMLAPAGLTMSGWTTMSFEVWLKLTSNNFGSSYPCVAGNDFPSSSKNGFSLILAPASDGKSGYFQLGFSGTSQVSLGFGAGQLAVGQWYHIVCVYDGAHMLVYLNGSQVASAVVTGTIGTAVDQLSIAQYPASSGVFVPGTFDEVAIYKNVALSSSRVTTHYNEGHNPGNRYGFMSYS